MKLNSAQGRLKGPEPVKERRAKGNLGCAAVGNSVAENGIILFDGSNSSSPPQDLDHWAIWALESRAVFWFNAWLHMASTGPKFDAWVTHLPCWKVFKQNVFIKCDICPSISTYSIASVNKYIYIYRYRYRNRQNYGKKNVSICRRRLSMIEKLRTFFCHNYFFP